MDPYKGQQAYVVGLRTLFEIPRFTTACSHDHDCNIKVHDSRPRLCKILDKFPRRTDIHTYYIHTYGRGRGVQANMLAHTFWALDHLLTVKRPSPTASACSFLAYSSVVEFPPAHPVSPQKRRGKPNPRKLSPSRAHLPTVPAGPGPA